MAKVLNSQQQHQPQRTCVACRETMTKGKLIRLVRTTSGEVQIDRIGGQPGRGAYLCAFQDCWEKGIRSNRLEYALRGGIDDESRKRLMQYGKSLPVRL